MREAWTRAKARIETERKSAPARIYDLRGNNRVAQTLTDKEALLVGAAGTGKTLAILQKLDGLMRAYPGARALIVRKVRRDLAETTLVTYERDVLGFDNPICAGIQRTSRLVYRYPEGSTVVIGGMDRPGAILSGEYDFIYPAEAVEFTEEDWETFVMRCRNGVVPFQQVLGDTNPSFPTHWLKQRCDAGRATLLNTYHKDNPAYWDGDDWTPLGRDYVLGTLQRLTGVRRDRFFEGLWRAAEGAVYTEWDDRIHLIDAFDIPKDWRRIRAIDFGFTNPFVCQWWAIDPDDRMYLYREIYMTGRLVEDHARQINELSAGEKIEATIADHDAEGRATLTKYGVRTMLARKEISDGIQAVQARLRVAGDGKPRLLVMRGALHERDETLADAKKPTCLAEEFPGYVWAKTPDGKPNKEEPLDLDNHALDAARYAVRYVDQPRGKSRQNPFF